MRPAFAVSLYLRDRRVLLVGSGPAIDDRVRPLEAAQAVVIRVHPSNYDFGMCRDAFLVMAQSGDPVLDRRIAGDARAAGCLAYAHDQPEVSDISMPALVRRGPLTLAVATHGAAPVLAGQVRRELARVLDGAGAALDALIGRMIAEREAPPSAERTQRLRTLAKKLRFDGQIVIDD